MSACPTLHLSGTAGQQQKEDPPQPQRGSGSWHLPVLPCSVLPSGGDGSALPSLHPETRPEWQVTSLGCFWGKESEKEDRKERVNKGPYQARLGRVPRGMASTLHTPLSWALKAGRGALRCLQTNTAGWEPRAQPLRGCKLSCQHWGCTS